MKSLTFAIVAASALVACSKKDSGTVFVFDTCDGSVGFQNIRPIVCANAKGGLHLDIGFAFKGTDLVAEITNHEVGTTISAGSIKPREQGDLVTVPVGDKLGAVTLDHLKGKALVELGLIFTIDSPRYAPSKLTLPPVNIASVFYDPATAERLLVQQKLGASEAAPAKHSTYIANRGYVLGDATSLADVDWVALPTFKERDESEHCAYETEKGSHVDIPKLVEVYTVKLVERRSGQVIETRDFRALGECPSFTSAHSIHLDFNHESWKAVEAWIAEKMNAV